MNHCTSHPWNHLPQDRCVQCALLRPSQKRRKQDRQAAEQHAARTIAGVERRRKQEARQQKKRANNERSVRGRARKRQQSTPCMGCEKPLPTRRKKCDECKARDHQRPPKQCVWVGCAELLPNRNRSYCDPHRREAARASYERKKSKKRKHTERQPLTISAFGETLTYHEWAERTGINVYTIYRRMERGWDPYTVLTRPTGSGGKKHPRRFIEHRGQRKSITEWARELGIDHTTLSWRIREWGVDRALQTPRLTDHDKRSSAA